MKSPARNLLVLTLTLGVLLGGAIRGYSDITLKVDTTKPWQGFMNVFSLPDYTGAYQFGSAWGLGALNAYFTGTSTLTLTPNTNLWNALDPYWVNTNTVPYSGNKFCEANCYVESTALRGNTVTFSGTVLSNNLYGGTSGHLVRAFVKTLDANAGYSLAPGAYQFVDLTNNSSSYAFSITVTIPTGANYIPQYGFVMTGPDVNPAWFATNGLVRIAADNSDPSITGQPINQRTVVGGSASFSVAATGGSTLSYQWKRYTTNLLNAGKFSGVTSPTLTITNAQLDDDTTYTVTVTDTAGSLPSSSARLRVVATAAEFANALDNPSFELDVTALGQVPDPWVNFSGSTLVSTNDGYAFDPINYPVLTISGTNAVRVSNVQEYNGFFQDAPALPGQIFTGDGWFYMSSQDALLGTCEAFLEVQFRQGTANPIEIYQSAKVDPSSPTDTWLFFQATNGVPAGYSAITTTNAYYLVAPAGTDHVRYQLTLHNIAFGGGGNIYLDAASVMKKIPVSVKTSVSGGNIILSWLTQGATSYQVVYKDNISDVSWTPLGGLIAGDGTVKSVSYAATESKRYYSVLTK